MTAVQVGILIGVVLGYYLGRTRAEVGAARHSGPQAMDRRAAYRQKR